jgi:2-polyprenyl-6-methoxyphenol hydroxylase-like FAD-dependent oxidoreductase
MSIAISPKSSRPRALIIGGSMSGLFSAALLARQGWDVDVFERSSVELAGRGAGISTHPELMRALDLAGASTDDLGVPVENRIVLDLAGNIIHEYPLREMMTSWDRLQRLLRRVIPSDRYHLGQNYIGFEQTETEVTANFENGRREKADLLIGADGFRSVVRNQLLPDLRPSYAGYVVWRGAPLESKLPDSVLNGIFNHFTISLPPRQQVVGYPIPGLGDDHRPGHRRYNFIWYRVVDETALVDLCTDATGKFHPFSIAPPLIRDDVIAAMRSDAKRNMPPQFLEVLAQVERPFFTPIYDLVAPRLAFGRVALVGDSASVSRPHMGFGVSKAGDDAVSLARALGEGRDVLAGMVRFDAERQPINEKIFQHGRKLGAYFEVDVSSEEERAMGEIMRRPEGIARHLAVPHFLEATET